MDDIITETQLREIFDTHLGDDAAFDLSVDEIESEDGEKIPLYLLKHPWSDPTLVLAVPLEVSDAKQLAETLERIDLPQSYSAIFHKKTRQLEVFWTAFKVREKHLELSARSFSIWWRNVERRCHFGPASEDARTLAGATLPLAAASHTEHRNIMSFHYFVHGSEHHNIGEPLCFWVDCSEIDDCDLDEYLKTVNFYMTYYDRETPRILIHEQGLTESGSTRPRYVEDTFPDAFVAGEVDPSVMSFWLGAFETRDPAMKYLLHYRLIEYLALSYIKSEQRKDLINILRRPHLISATEGAAAEIAGLFTSQARDTDRLKSFIGETVRPTKVWAVLEMNSKEFSSPSVFDGGFEISASIGNGATFESWEKIGPISLVDKLRAIRNCLAHGQDDGTKGVIHATYSNRRVITPWVNLIETFAAEAMLFSRKTYASGEAR